MDIPFDVLCNIYLQCTHLTKAMMRVASKKINNYQDTQIFYTERSCPIVIMAARECSLNLCKYLKVPPKYESVVCRESLSKGNTEITEWLLQNTSRSQEILYKIAQYGESDLFFKYYDGRNPDIFCRYAALSGNLEFYLSLEKESDADLLNLQDIFKNASKSGSLELLKYLHNRYGKNKEDICYEAARNGHLEVVRSYYDLYGSKISSLGYNGVEANNWNIIKWSFGKGCLFHKSKNAVVIAAKNNNLDLVRWLYRKGCNLKEECLEHAVRNNNIKMLKWLYKKGIVSSQADCISCCIERNEEKIIKWLLHKRINQVTDSHVTLARERNAFGILKLILCRVKN